MVTEYHYRWIAISVFTTTSFRFYCAFIPSFQQIYCVPDSVWLYAVKYDHELIDHVEPPSMVVDLLTGKRLAAYCCDERSGSLDQRDEEEPTRSNSRNRLYIIHAHTRNDAVLEGGSL